MNICIFGDSITWGASDYEKGGWVERLKSYYMENREDVDVYNLGVSGDNTADLLRRLEVEVKMREPSLIILAIGINDSQYIQRKGNYKINPDRFENNLSELLSLAQKITDKIVFIGLTTVDESKTTPIPWSPEKYYDNESVEKYDGIIKNFCKKNNLNYISMKEVISATDLEDGLHPNSQGHGKIFKAVLKTIEKSLR